MDQGTIRLSILAATIIVVILVNVLERRRRKTLSEQERNAEGDEWENHERNAG